MKLGPPDNVFWVIHKFGARACNSLLDRQRNQVRLVGRYSIDRD